MAESQWFCPCCDGPVGTTAYVLLARKQERIHLDCLLSGRQLLRRMAWLPQPDDSEGVA